MQRDINQHRQAITQRIQHFGPPLLLLGAALFLGGCPLPNPVTFPNGVDCTANGDCRSGYCADGRICAPKDGEGVKDEYCHHDNHCASGVCVCPNDPGGHDGGFCKDWVRFDTTTHGRCLAQNVNGQQCRDDANCESGNCADGRCAPEDGKGRNGEYCHHNNHCQTGTCTCVNGVDLLGFCLDWENHTEQEILAGGGGRCSSVLSLGSTCKKDSQCGPGNKCADAWRLPFGRCAPADTTGLPGEYCHHDNHCASGSCNQCVKDGAFCKNWEAGRNLGRCG